MKLADEQSLVSEESQNIRQGNREASGPRVDIEALIKRNLFGAIKKEVIPIVPELKEADLNLSLIGVSPRTHQKNSNAIIESSGKQKIYYLGDVIEGHPNVMISEISDDSVVLKEANGFSILKFKSSGLSLAGLTGTRETNPETPKIAKENKTRLEIESSEGNLTRFQLSDESESGTIANEKDPGPLASLEVGVTNTINPNLASLANDSKNMETNNRLKAQSGIEQTKLFSNEQKIERSEKLATLNEAKTIDSASIPSEGFTILKDRLSKSDTSKSSIESLAIEVSSIAPRVISKKADAALSKALEKMIDLAKRDKETIYSLMYLSPVEIDSENFGYRITPGRNSRLFRMLGLRYRDILTKVNDVEISKNHTLESLIDYLAGNDEIELHLIRNKQRFVYQYKI